MASSKLSEEDLRGLYLDWCSTQVARRFLELSGDEVWLRSHSAAAFPVSPPLPSPPPSPSPSLVVVDRIPDYLEIVRRTALSLAQEMDLPSFGVWRERYLVNPEEYVPDILGR